LSEEKCYCGKKLHHTGNHKGIIPWNKNKHGFRTWNKGIPRTEAEKRSISVGTKIGMSKVDPALYFKGVPRLNLRGENNPAKRPEVRRKISEYASKRKFIPSERHYELILKETDNLRNQGFRCIPIGKVIPDIIAFKDSKIYAIEVECDDPDYSKYTSAISQLYDDIVWVTYHNGERVKCQSISPKVDTPEKKEKS